MATTGRSSKVTNLCLCCNWWIEWSDNASSGDSCRLLLRFNKREIMQRFRTPYAYYTNPAGSSCSTSRSNTRASNRVDRTLKATTPSVAQREPDGRDRQVFEHDESSSGYPFNHRVKFGPTRHINDLWFEDLKKVAGVDRVIIGDPSGRLRHFEGRCHDPLV